MDPKQHILTAAQSIFARHGFRQTAMAMVAEEAGLSRQALYHHFASKEALFAALVDELHETAFAAAKTAAADDTGSASDVIAGVMVAYHRSLASRLSGSPFTAELIEESGRQCGPAVAAFARRFDKHLETIIAGLVGEGRLRLRPGVAPRELAEMVSIAARGVKSAYAGESETRYARALERMIAIVCAGAEALSDAARVRSVKKPQAVTAMRGRSTR